MPPSRPASLATAMELDGVLDVTTLQEALANTEGMKMVWVETPIVVNKETGSTVVTDLPATENLNTNGGKKKNQWLEIIPNHAGALDFSALESLFLQQRYADLPEPVKIKADPRVPYTMQLFIIAGDAGTKTLVKHFRIANGGKVTEGTMHAMAHGSVFDIDYSGHSRDGPRGLQYLLEGLGGFRSDMPSSFLQQRANTFPKKPVMSRRASTT